MVTAYLVLLTVLAGERLVELVLSRRHAAWAKARGGIEVGRGHFRFMALLHTGLLVGCAAEVLLLGRPFYLFLAAPLLVLGLLAQGLRYWAVATLGPLWNVRVIVVPGTVAVERGPYRWVRHPNYVAVVVEGIAVPLLHTAWITALAFTVLNAALLVVRIRCEERALATHMGYAERFGERPRFLPRLLGG
ncbi:MAG TPA: isoprenylcysteine carboxylmethyltransferase family protein [Myxococcales bacterium]|jgi:methyltransferase